MKNLKKLKNWNRTKNLGNYAKKGSVPWNKGVPRLKKTKQKISNTRKIGFLNGKISHPKGMLGKKHSEEAIERIKKNWRKYNSFSVLFTKY